jgi:hypothetical protein
VLDYLLTDISCHSPVILFSFNSTQVIRKGGLRWPLLYTLLGGEWEPIIIDAKIGMGAGGNSSSMSLLEQREPRLDGSDGGDGGAALAAHPHIKRVQQPVK